MPSSSSSAVFNPSSCSTLCNRRLPFLIPAVGFFRFSGGLLSTEVFFDFFAGCCFTSLVFTRFVTGSVGLLFSVDVFGLDRLRVVRLTGDALRTITCGSGRGEAFFSKRAERFFFELVGSSSVVSLDTSSGLLGKTGEST